MALDDHVVVIDDIDDAVRPVFRVNVVDLIRSEGAAAEEASKV
jgi:hypothetical protein